MTKANDTRPLVITGTAGSPLSLDCSHDAKFGDFVAVIHYTDTWVRVCGPCLGDYHKGKKA